MFYNLKNKKMGALLNSCLTGLFIVREKAIGIVVHY